MSDRVGIRHVLTNVLQRWWLVVLIVAVGGASGYALSSRIDPVYEAKTTLLVGDPTGSVGPSKDAIEASQLLASTYANLIRSKLVLDGIVDELGLEISWVQLRDVVRADIGPQGSQTIGITVYADSPRLAKRIAAAVGERAVGLSPSGGPTAEGISDFTSQRIAVLQRNIRTAQEEIAILQSQLASGEYALEEDELKAQIRDQEELIIGWQDNYSSLLNYLAAEGSTNSIQVLDTASATPSPIRPDTAMNIGFGVGIGFLVALGIAYALSFRESVWREETLEPASPSVVSRLEPRAAHIAATDRAHGAETLRDEGGDFSVEI